MAKYTYEQFAATRLIRETVRYSPDGGRIMACIETGKKSVQQVLLALLTHCPPIDLITQAIEKLKNP